MGVFKKDTIQNDFKVASKGRFFPVGSFISECAELILDFVPDNEARDMAISHLLSATEMVLNSYLLHNKAVDK